MSKKCSICTDAFEAAKVDKCPKCRDLVELNIDRIAILLRHAKRIPQRAERYLARVEHFKSIDAMTGKHCKICGTSPTMRNRNWCQDCNNVKKRIDDPYEICQYLIRKRPEKAAQYQAMADQHRQRLIETSADPEREIRTNRRLAKLAADTKPCKPRIMTTNGIESTDQYWRCGRCRNVLTKPSCLKCEQIIKGEIQDD